MTHRKWNIGQYWAALASAALFPVGNYAAELGIPRYKNHFCIDSDSQNLGSGPGPALFQTRRIGWSLVLVLAPIPKDPIYMRLESGNSIRRQRGCPSD